MNKKNNIAIIGAGKISYSLTSALIKAGYKISVIISKREKSAESLAKKFQIKKFSNNLEDISFKSGIFFLAVPDAQIRILAKELSKLNFNFSNSIFIHLSGALNISELKSLKNKNAKTASFHIMQTFPFKKIINIKNFYAAIETNDNDAKKFLFDISNKLFLQSFEIKSSEKTLYHLAGTFASNFLVGNIFNSELLLRFGVKKNIIFYDAVKPIIQSTLENIKNFGVADALSGPVERGDIQTIKMHLVSLKKRNRILYFTYIIQSLNLLEIVKIKRSKLSENHIKIKNLLEEKLKDI